MISECRCWVVPFNELQKSISSEFSNLPMICISTMITDVFNRYNISNNKIYAHNFYSRWVFIFEISFISNRNIIWNVALIRPVALNRSLIKLEQNSLKHRGYKYQKQMSKEQTGVSLSEIPFHCPAAKYYPFAVRCSSDTAFCLPWSWRKLWRVHPTWKFTAVFTTVIILPVVLYYVKRDLWVYESIINGGYFRECAERNIWNDKQWSYRTKNGVFWDVTPCGITSQKTPFFIVTAVKTSNLTSYRMLESTAQWGA
jgi:hypothetical protein